jgi:endonuclease
MREAEFRKYLETRDLAEKTVLMTVYAIRRIEKAYNVNVDKEFERDGLASLLASFTYSSEDARTGRANPSKMEMDPSKIYNQAAWYRHKVRLYQAFLSGVPAIQVGGEAEAPIIDDDDDDVGRTFGLERDLQLALRANIQQLEAGLVIADGGAEARVEAGLIDILAKDTLGRWVVIELKADVARPAAITQLLAYMGCVASERSGDVRGILVASDFDRKINLAVRTVPTVSLKRYRFQFSFD